MVTMRRAEAQVAAVFMARAAVQIPIFRILKVIKVVLTSNLARVISSSSRGDTRPIQSSSTVDSIMCLLPVCASETRSFIRGL